MIAMTPIEINVLTHYHYSTIEHPRVDMPSVQDAIRMWVNEGILIQDMETEIYRTSYRGSVLVKMLCDTPMPIKVWSDPRG